MLEFKRGTGTSLEHGNQSATRPLRASLHSSHSGCLCASRASSKASPSGFASPVPPSDGFEPQADVVVRPSALHLAERIFKRLLKLRKRFLWAGFSSCFLLDPSRAVTEVGAVRSYSLNSVDVERGYDSDAQSAGFVSVDTPTSSSSMGSSSFESFAATSSSHAPSANSHKPACHMMANVLLSLLADDASSIIEEDRGRGSGHESEEEYNFGGPRESAWHQSEDEILTDQEWRTMHYAHLQGKFPAVAATATTKLGNRGTGEHSTSKQPTIAAAHYFSSNGSKRETTKHMY